MCANALEFFETMKEQANLFGLKLCTDFWVFSQQLGIRPMDSPGKIQVLTTAQLRNREIQREERRDKLSPFTPLKGRLGDRLLSLTFLSPL